MAQVTGRTTESRSVAGVVRTNTSTAITAPAGSFQAGDVGRTIVATGIPAAATITAVASATAATLSAAATSTTTGAATIGASTGVNTGFIGWNPESEAEAGTYSVTAVNAGQTPPDRITGPSVDQRALIERSR